MNPIPLAESAALNDSYTFCRQQASQQSNFYLGMYLTTKKKRDALFAIYAWLRAVDDIADDKHESREQRLKNLENFQETTLSVLQNDAAYCKSLPEKYWLAFRQAVIDYQIPYQYLEEMIAGQEQDLFKHNYDSFSELYKYCYLVASVVGLMCLRIWGCDDEKNGKKHAESLGIALQISNILRDLKEDLKLNRIYLPGEFVGANNLTVDSIKKIPDQELMIGVTKLIDENKKYYTSAIELCNYVHIDSMLSVLMLLETYRSIFKKICANPEKTMLDEKIRINKLDKAVILLRVFWKYSTRVMLGRMSYEPER